MACPEFEDLILDYSEGTAKPADSARVELHVADCRDCRELLAIQQELESRLADALPSPALSPAFGPALAARIAVQRHTPRHPRLPLILDWIGYLSLAFAFGRLMQQLPHAGTWIGLAGLAGSAAFGLWESGKALRGNFGHR